MQHFSPDTAWMLVAAGMGICLPAGLLLVERATSRTVGGVHGAPRVMLDLAIAVVLTWVCGYAWIHGPSFGGLLGMTPGPIAVEGDPTGWRGAVVLWHAMAVGSVVVLAGSGGAERARPVCSALAALLVAGLVVPLVAHWAWGGRPEGVAVGWLGRLGFLDQGGAVVVHIVAGSAALAVAAALGPRSGRFDSGGRPRVLPLGDLWLEGLGSLLMVIGVLGLIGGARLGWRPELPQGLVNGTVAAAGGLIAAACTNGLEGRRLSVRVLRLGAVAGAVSVSAGALLGSSLWAAAIGAAGGALSVWIDRMVLRSRVDDPLGVAGSHLAPGVWGAVAAAFVVAEPGLPGRLLVQGLGAVVVAAFAFLVVHQVLSLVDRRVPLRLSPFSEERGSGLLDVVLRGRPHGLTGTHHVLRDEER